jgi:GAF domain-containing protein
MVVRNTLREDSVRTESGQQIEDMRERLKLLERFSRISQTLMGNLGATSIDDRLTLIAQNAVELLEAEACGVLLVKHEGYLSLEASYGHQEGAFQKGRELPICSGIKSGLTGQIAHQGKIFNSHGDDLTKHPAVTGANVSHTKSGKCHSLLAIPLMKCEGAEQRLIGLLRVDNKKGKDGIPSASDKFTVEDESLLRIFAETVVVALQNAALVDQLSEKRDVLEHMIDSVRETEGQLQLLLRASNTMIAAEGLDKSLQSLAEMLVSLLKHTFCRIGLFAEGDKCIVIRAAHPIGRSERPLKWQHEKGQQIALNQCPQMNDLMKAANPVVLRYEDASAQRILVAQRRRLHLDKDIQSLLLVHLRIGERTIGMIEVGELRTKNRSLFSQEQIDLVSTIAAQTVYFIDRMRQHEISDRRRMLLLKLNKALLHIREDREWPKLVQEVVTQAAYLLDCEISCLYLNHPGIDELELIAVSGLAPELVGTRISHREGLVGLSAISGHADVEIDYHVQSEHENMFLPCKIRTAAVAPLKWAEQVKMVLFVADTKIERLWSETDNEVLHVFAERAAIAIEACQLMKQDASALKHLILKSRINEYAQLAGNLDKILHAILTAVTAGYGLGFNRAALFLLDEHNNCFVGKSGIGYLDRNTAEHDWEDHKERGLEDLAEYLLQLEHGDIPSTPLGEIVCGMRVRIEDVANLLQVVHDRRVKLIVEEEKYILPGLLIEAFQPSLPLVVASVTAKGKSLGFLIADNKFTGSPITEGNLEQMADFAKMVGNAVVGDIRETFWRNILFDAAHTMIHPISTIELFLKPLARRIESNPREALKLLERIELSVDQSKRIIAQAKLLTRGEQIPKSATDIIPLVHAACELAELHGIKVTRQVTPCQPQNVLADPTQLSECFNEMVMNALRWLVNNQEKLMDVIFERLSPESGSDKTFVCIHFHDNGPGVPKELKQRIFDPFFSTSKDGDGFGLSHAKRIILEYGGLIREVGLQGQGADFEIYLPLS